jgi:hypothetical protein
MILPVGPGRREGIPSPYFYLIVGSGHSPLSFALGRWSHQHPILGTTVSYWLTTSWSHNPSHTLSCQPPIYTASTGGGVDVAFSDRCKAIGMGSHPIVPHRQIQWV